MEAIQTIGGGSAAQFQLQAARREAQQAEQTVQELSTQAQNAQSSADQEQNRANNLGNQAHDALQRSGAARQNISAMSARQQPSVVVSAPAPFVNVSGQIMGLLLNTQA